MINLLLVWTATRKREGYPDCFEFVVKVGGGSGPKLHGQRAGWARH
jgi:hypothetical protein